MTMKFPTSILSLPALVLASCAMAASGDSAAGTFAIEPAGSFDEPWALAFAPGTQVVFITEKGGTMKFVDLPSGKVGTVTGLPKVAYGGQGGLGDVAFLPSEAASTLGRRTIYLTWAGDAGDDKLAAMMGKGTLVCDTADACRIEGLTEIWRQDPAIRSPGHFSHKIAFSPDGKYLFLSSGERMQGAPAQDLGTNLGKVLRLNHDGTPADGNPFAERGGVSRQIWSYGHRNLLGLKFDLDGQLWDLEHGPRGGDEINMVEPGANYGWPVRSNGSDYNGDDIPDHTADDGFSKPAIWWTPVIAPGDFLFYSGKLWPEWRNQALIANLGTQSLVRVGFEGGKGTELQRTDFGKRLRDIAEAPDGSLYVIEDGEGGRLLHLTPAK
ncbi:PQQ-dependent sugar dehydrogenase [Altererythrobacter salegens]|uniref:PQQ-dependent sugar dehydrogenase n=1 Tax=Croceibacterium salegens TaxID=1737568 RepID=A0A6I4T221_9SPHN|nr:PQQ-dependent sugar dehydrogenase [Croceibacterium salegens]MXO61376.1 PQQ-dependent sugar dehydrogenase [Croceibacterium salegens]